MLSSSGSSLARAGDDAARRDVDLVDDIREIRRHRARRLQAARRRAAPARTPGPSRASRSAARRRRRHGGCRWSSTSAAERVEVGAADAAPPLRASRPPGRPRAARAPLALASSSSSTLQSIVSRSVCWRAGRSRGPPVRSASRASRRCSSSSRRQGSDARGGELDRERQPVDAAADLAHVRLVRRRRARTLGSRSRARCAKSSTAASSSSGATGKTCSPETWRTARLVTSSVSRGARATSSA